MGKFLKKFLIKIKYNTIKSRKNHKIEKYQMNKKLEYPSLLFSLKRKNYVNYKKPNIVSKSQTIED